MSQTELARRTNMGASTLSRLEAGERCPSVDHLAPWPQRWRLNGNRIVTGGED